MERTLLIIETIEAIAIVGLFLFIFMIYKEIGPVIEEPVTEGETPV